MNVLIVEDDELNSEALRALLDQHGATVLGPVYSIASAVGFLPLQDPCVAILNFNLGEATCEPLIDLLRSQTVPFVIVTAVVLQLLPSSIQSERVVVKPYTFDLLLMEIAGAMQDAADRAIVLLKGRPSSAD